jgi:hypothetical protein
MKTIPAFRFQKPQFLSFLGWLASCGNLEKDASVFARANPALD